MKTPEYPKQASANLSKELTKELSEKLTSKLNNISTLEPDVYAEINRILDQQSTPKGVDEKGRLKVAMFDAKPYDIEAFAKQNHPTLNFVHHQIPLNEESANLAKGTKVVCIFVNDICNATVVDTLAKLGVELIALRCAGFNNVDLDACRHHNIDVVRVPAYSPQAVAEHSVALMLMLARNLHRAYLRNRSGQFTLDGLVGFNMHQKTVGVIGTGQIGECVVNILRGFGCKVLAYDVNKNPKLTALTDVKYTSLSALLSQSDIITLHAPLLNSTHHCIDQDSISTMKDGVMLINTSRGALVDAKALIKGLKSGKISAAGLDVYEEEEGIFFNDMSNQILNDDVFARLMSFNNVVITSHQAFLTKEALANIAQTSIANIDEYQQGKRNRQLSNAVG